MSRLLLVRHGQASFLADDYDNLSELGRRQCRLLGEYWAAHGLKFDRLYQGPRKRHRQSAEEAALGYGASGGTLPDVVELPDLDEFAWGELMSHAENVLAHQHEEIGRLRRAFEIAEDRADKHRTMQHLVEAITQMWFSETINEPEIESWPAFRDRVYRGIATMTADAPRGSHVAVFTSGGTVSAVLHHVLHMPASRTVELVWTLRNAALTEILFSGDRFNLSSFNEAPHLPTRDLWTFR